MPSIDTTQVSTQAYVKPQRLVAVDGTRRLNLFCMGHGAPTVMLDSGTGGGTRDWRDVQGAIAQQTTVCSYDRAGYGFSDGTTRSSDARNAADDLHRLVARAGLQKPLVLVGHSNGGMYAMRYAETYPQEVGGMVLVDPGFNGQQNFERYGLVAQKISALRKGNNQFIAFARHCLKLATSGELVKPVNRQSPCLDNPPNPDPLLHKMLNDLEVKRSFFEAYLSEFENTFVMTGVATANDREVPLTAHAFRSIPLIVLTASRHPAQWSDFTADDQKKYFAFWKNSHDHLATLSTRGQSIQVESSGHFIQKDQPAVVIRYVNDVVEQVRRGISAPH